MAGAVVEEDLGSAADRLGEQVREGAAVAGMRAVIAAASCRTSQRTSWMQPLSIPAGAVARSRMTAQSGPAVR